MNKNKGCIPEADKIYSKSELVDIAIEWSSYLGTTGKTSHWYEQFLEWLSRRDKKGRDLSYLRIKSSRSCNIC
jgi:hypothetical protein